MDQVAQESGAAAELSRHLQKGSTGRLSVGAPGYEVDVYVMNGQVVAAECPDDIRLLLRRLAAAGALSGDRAAELGGMAELGEGVFGLLLEEIPEAVMETALFDRFRDNLARFLGSNKPAEFHPMGAVFVENFQMGHDTPALLRECAAMWRQSKRIPLSAVVETTHPEDATADQVLVVEALDGTKTVRQVLHELPLEPIYGRAVIAQMIANGIATRVKGDPSSVAITTPAPEPRAAAPKAASETPRYEEPPTAHDSPTEMSLPMEEDLQETEVIEPRIPDADAAMGDLDPDLPDEMDLQATEVVESDVPPAGDPGVAGDDWANFLAPIQDDPLAEDSEDDADGPTLTGDPSQVLERLEQLRNTPAPAATRSPRFGTGKDVSAWLDPGDGLDDDILEAFADHDQVRGAADDGTFSQEQEALDRVEVTSLPSEDDEEIIEVGEAPVARFSAKALSESQAFEKIAVANECLEQIVAAFDAAEGAGRGRAALQLLVDGSPSKFAALFHEVVLDANGTMPAGRLLRNLHTRPPTEHRQLLNNGLVDLIERGLSLVMDELEDDGAIDAALEATAGYRQRIGL